MWESSRVRLMCMLGLTFVFFVVEVVVSRVTGSLAMLSDSFHMLSDVIALIVGLIAVRFAQKTHSTDKNTFGWIRAGVMGALVNAIFLTALCFTIVLEAIERFTEPQAIEQPLVVIGVGAGGLLVNLIGLCMFRDSAGAGHGHSHGGGAGDSGHGHSHGAKKSHRNRERAAGDGGAIDREETNILVENCGNSHGLVVPGKHADALAENAVEHRLNGNVVDNNSEDLHEDGSQLNMRGVFLHVLGDALGSVIVVVNAFIFYMVFNPCQSDVNCVNPCIHEHCTHLEGVNHTLGVLANSSEHPEIQLAGPCWVLYLDPSLCVIMVCILLYTTYPLLKESALILLQTVPKQIDISSLKKKLRSLEGVEAVHELHVWQLAESRIIATAHIKCHDPTAYMDVAKRIKDFFHDEGIHATTIQPEFSSVESGSRISLCELSCRTQCAPKQCCGSTEKNASGKKSSGGTAAIPSLGMISESPEHKTKRTNTSEKSAHELKIDVDSTV
ncbi:proton-coupled zinc antiporter SLC30A1 [Spea bombifrons]|uniref:proton-coupled zinc antiporter SLC30A1 n=1 Tax=Spea bombifrons TaxID=233779 RepID=UPI00234BCF82|nr:proton-coupled zinc antiporter SLC30A1 [Spea bombifrons]